MIEVYTYLIKLFLDSLSGSHRSYSLVLLVCVVVSCLFTILLRTSIDALRYDAISRSPINSFFSSSL